jgi:hypothetical protein
MRKSTTSMHKLVLSGIAFAGGMAGTVQAGTLESAVVYGGPSQSHVACAIVNMKDAPITFVKKQLVGQFHGTLDHEHFFDNCGTTLGAGAMCSFQAAAVRESAACKVIINEANTNVRGTMQALTDPVGNPTPLSEADLR